MSDDRDELRERLERGQDAAHDLDLELFEAGYDRIEWDDDGEDEDWSRKDRLLAPYRATRTGLSWLVDTGYRLPRRTVQSIQRTAVGDAESYTTRIGWLVMLAATAIVAMGAYAAVIAGFDTSGSSGGVMRVAFTVMTSWWTYVLVGGAAVIGLKAFKDRREASIASRKTGFATETIDRLAAEAKTTDGCTTVVVSPSDTLHDITNRVLAAVGVDSVRQSNDHLQAVRECIGETTDGVLGTQPEIDAATERVAPETSSVEEQIRLTRLELASAVSFRELAWRFLAPAIATVVVLLILVQIWVAPWVYPVIGAVGLIIGSAYYQYTRWRRRRRLHSLRTPPETPSWSDIAVMVKRVETQDTTAYYGWVAGKTYVDYDAERLATTVAWAAYAHVHDEDIPPTIQQKFARNIRQHVPNLRGYEENIEKPEIMDTLADEVARSDHDIVPKDTLAEAVIGRDRQRIGGVGYDPRLVAECYRMEVPYALVEEPVDVTTGTGEIATLTAVRLRTSPIPGEKATAEAEFSAKFDPNANSEYPLPKVDHSTDIVV